ncbi:MAG: DUF177 domain-containing protein [Pseudomonadota bacterium]|nr:DUF177 domain-containing protein [Pseudomonadota bacterium]
MSVPEFCRLEQGDTIGADERQVSISADEAERGALARRFGLKAIERLDADFTLHRDAVGIVARGRVRAAVVQACVVTDAPVPAAIDEQVALRFVVDQAAGDEERELNADDCDVVAYDGAAIDLGEAAAETMALALDPFPRAPGAAAALRDAGGIGEEDAGPFGALAGLKAMLGKG